jgi:FkbM family methyltransferase
MRTTQPLLRITAAGVRAIPVNRKIKDFFVVKTAALRNHHYDFTFHCSRIDIDWSASAFPDILTRHMLFEGMYQEDVLVALRSTVRPGDTVFDVGGHHGLMAVIGARATGPRGRVVSFEPNPASRKQIERHAQLNGVTNIRIEPIALSDRNGEHEFFVQSGDVSWNSTLIKAFADAENTPGRRIEKISVATCRLDDYVARSGCVPKVIKIDTEGSEFMVLRGALDTIERHRPVLIMEFNPALGRVGTHDDRGIRRPFAAAIVPASSTQTHGARLLQVRTTGTLRRKATCDREPGQRDLHARRARRRVASTSMAIDEGARTPRRHLYYCLKIAFGISACTPTLPSTSCVMRRFIALLART